MSTSSQASDSTAKGRCKGTLLVNLRSHVTSTDGEAAWTTLVRGSSPADIEVLESPLLVSSWYPVGVWNRALRAQVRAHGDDVNELRKVARHVADRDLNTVLKFILSIANADTIVGRTGMFWSRYFDRGSLTPEKVGPNEWVLTIEGPTGEDAGAGEMTCGEGVSKWVQTALELTGVKSAKVVHERCRFRGQPECRTRVSW